MKIPVSTYYCPSNRTTGFIDLQFLVPGFGRPLPNPAAGDYLLCKGSNGALCTVTQVPGQARGMFDVNTRTRIADVLDGTSQTFAVGEGAGNNLRFPLRRYYPDQTPEPDRTTGQPRLADQSWAAGSLATDALHSTPYLWGSTVGVTAQRGGFIPAFDEPMNNPLVMGAVDYNCGCTNSSMEVRRYDLCPASAASIREVATSPSRTAAFASFSSRSRPRRIVPFRRSQAAKRYPATFSLWPNLECHWGELPRVFQERGQLITS